jgi:hypothetical protein
MSCVAPPLRRSRDEYDQHHATNGKNVKRKINGKGQALSWLLIF